jgi:hypothetical protein
MIAVSHSGVAHRIPRDGSIDIYCEPVGVVDQKDLGADTAQIVGAMAQFNPDSTWTEVADSDLIP